MLAIGYDYVSWRRYSTREDCVEREAGQVSEVRSHDCGLCPEARLSSRTLKIRPP